PVPGASKRAGGPKTPPAATIGTSSSPPAASIAFSAHGRPATGSRTACTTDRPVSRHAPLLPRGFRQRVEVALDLVSDLPAARFVIPFARHLFVAQIERLLGNACRGPPRPFNQERIDPAGVDLAQLV